jgi:carbon storage regulator CsrA
MLVVSRKSTEAIVIGEAAGLCREFRISVLAIQGGRVKLGIEADPDTVVLRSELVQTIPVAGRSSTADRGVTNA